MRLTYMVADATRRLRSKMRQCRRAPAHRDMTGVPPSTVRIHSESASVASAFVPSPPPAAAAVAVTGLRATLTAHFPHVCRVSLGYGLGRFTSRHAPAA